MGADAWGEDESFDSDFGDDPEARSDFADDGWQGDEGIIERSGALDFWERDGDGGDDSTEPEFGQSGTVHRGIDHDGIESDYYGAEFADVGETLPDETMHSGFAMPSAEDGWEDPVGPDAWEDAMEAERASVERMGEMLGGESDWNDEASDSWADAVAGDGSQSWSKGADEEWSDEVKDEVNDAVRRLNPDGDPDWGVPEDVLDNPDWELSGRDMGVFFDLEGLDTEDGKPLGTWDDFTEDEQAIHDAETERESFAETMREVLEDQADGGDDPGSFGTDADDNSADDADQDKEDKDNMGGTGGLFG